MALSSSTTSKSVVELSESPVYHFEFSSIYKTLNYLSNSEIDVLKHYCLSYLSSSSKYLLQLDTTPSERTHSPSLPNRHYVKVPNQVVRGNAPVSVGYNLSFLNVQPLKGEKWSLPVDIKRLPLEQDAKQVGVSQLQIALSDPDLPFKDADLIVNTADSSYKHPSFIAPLYGQKDLVNIIRLSKGQKVYKLAHRTNTGGRNAYKGQKAYLLWQSALRKAGKHTYQANSIFDTFDGDHYEYFNDHTYKGRAITICLWRFNDLLLETKKGYSMLDKPIDLVCSIIYDSQTGKQLFKEPMYIAITNQRRRQISTKEAFMDYRHRYDIEPSLRFSKQHLKLDQYKTCDIQHYDNWFVIYQLAYWLLFVASDEADYQPAKWRSYKTVNKAENIKEHLTPCQTFRACQNLLLKIDQKPFKPRPSNKGCGREIGTVFEKRERHKVLKKRKKQTCIDKKDRQNI